MAEALGYPLLTTQSVGKRARDGLSSLEGEERLDASAIKNLDDSGGGISEIDRARIEVLEEKTVDTDVTQELGPFADIPDATLAGIAVVADPSADQIIAINRGTFDFSTLVYAVSQPLPSDTAEYSVIVRLTEAELNFITAYRMAKVGGNLTTAIQSSYLSREQGGWAYYSIGTRTKFGNNDSVRLQKRSTIVHNRYHGTFAGAAVEQIEELAAAQGSGSSSGATAQGQA